MAGARPVRRRLRGPALTSLPIAPSDPATALAASSRAASPQAGAATRATRRVPSRWRPSPLLGPLRLWTLTLWTLIAAAAPTPVGAADLHDVIRDCQRKVVKIYGAGGVRGLEAYQTGVLISAEGHVLTALSYVLDTNELAVVLDDGRKFAAEIVGSDPVCELTLLRIAVGGESVAHFDLDDSAAAQTGDRVLALSNLFGIAAGDEAVSVLHGVVTAVAPLEARRGSFQANYRGPVYVLDAQANNPGAAGGALVGWDGRLLGILGKELQSSVTHAWLHYALPVDAFAAAVRDLRAGRGAQARSAALLPPDDPLTLDDLGLALVPDLLPRTPPYVDAIRDASPARQAGLQPDDLIVFVGGEPTASCAEVVAALQRHEKRAPVAIGVLRRGQLQQLEVGLTLNPLRSVRPRDETAPADAASPAASEPSAAPGPAAPGPAAPDPRGPAAPDADTIPAGAAKGTP